MSYTNPYGQPQGIARLDTNKLMKKRDMPSI